MAKVRDVLAQIGDKPLVEALQERGFNVYVSAKTGHFEMAAELEEQGYLVVDTDHEVHKLVSACEEQGYVVLDANEYDIQHGYDLYVTRKSHEFRQWLRDLFWQSLGRIA